MDKDLKKLVRQVVVNQLKFLANKGYMNRDEVDVLSVLYHVAKGLNEKGDK